MVAHLHGQLFNASSIASSLGVSSPTVTRYLDHLVQCLMLRRLKPFHANLGKRLVKSPKIFEIKFSSAPKVSKGFWQACEDVGVNNAYVVAPVQEGWMMANNVQVISPIDIPSHIGLNIGT
jgi:hypothetical protein